jgi:hypothetical protein
MIGVGLKITLPQNIDIIVESKVPGWEVNAGLFYTYQRINLLFGARYLRSEASDKSIRLSDVHASAGALIYVGNYTIGYSFIYGHNATAHQVSIMIVP